MINQSELEFEKIGTRYVKDFVDIPFYLWERHLYFERFMDRVRKTERIVLNNLEILFINPQYVLGMANFNTQTIMRVRFLDNETHKWVAGGVVTTPIYGKLSQSVMEKEDLVGCHFNIEFNGKRNTVSMYTHEGFFVVPDLAELNAPVGHMHDCFQAGISAKQYKILYKGRWLDGKSFAFIYGTVGILLSDTLAFDSLVLLRGVGECELVVEQFVHTVNPYVLKAMMLLR